MGWWLGRRPRRIFFWEERTMNEQALMDRLDRMTKAMEEQARTQAEANKVVKELVEATYAVLNVLVTSLTEDAVDDGGMGEVLQYLGDKG